jgi:hypothetical protein
VDAQYAALRQLGQQTDTVAVELGRELARAARMPVLEPWGGLGHVHGDLVARWSGRFDELVESVCAERRQTAALLATIRGLSADPTDRQALTDQLLYGAIGRAAANKTGYGLDRS